MKPAPPDMNEIQSRVSDSFQRQPFMKTLNAELLSIDYGLCEMKVPYRAELTQQHGYFHAGVIATLADNSAGYAGFSAMQPTSAPLTVEFKINLMNPGQGEYLLARGSVIKNGRTLKICQSEVFAHNGGEEKLIAVAIVTLMELENTSDSIKQ